MKGKNNSNNELFIKFVRGLYGVLRDMNLELNVYTAMIDVEQDCTKVIAKASQLDSDINRLFDYIDDFFEKEGLKDE